MKKLNLNFDRRMKFRIIFPSIAVVVFILDQITKALIANHVAEGTIFWSTGKGFFRIIHARNTAVAFSLGDEFPDWLKIILFKVVVAAFLGWLLYYFIKNIDKFPGFQKFSMALILGGGFGNLADRIFRPDGVVDFLDVKFYGIFGMERWPTFNVADSALVVGCIAMAICFLVEGIRERKQRKKK